MKKLCLTVIACISNSLFSANHLSSSAPTATGTLDMQRSPSELSVNATPVGSPSSFSLRRGSHVPALVFSGRNSPAACDNPNKKVTIGFGTPLTPPSSSTNSPRTPNVQEYTPPTPKSTTTSTCFKPLETLTRHKYTTNSQELTSEEINALKKLGGLSLSAHTTLLNLAHSFAPEGREDFLTWVADNAPADSATFRAYISNPTNQTAVWGALQSRYNTSQGGSCDLSKFAKPVDGWPYEENLSKEQVAEAFAKRTDPLLIAAVLTETKRNAEPLGIKVWSAKDGEIYYLLRRPAPLS